MNLARRNDRDSDDAMIKMVMARCDEKTAKEIKKTMARSTAKRRYKKGVRTVFNRLSRCQGVAVVVTVPAR